MEELLGVFVGFVLAAAASVGLARHQQRHETRVRILREILPRITYPPHSLPERTFDAVDDLVTAAIVLRHREREAVGSIYDVFAQRKRMEAVPGPPPEALTPERANLQKRHQQLSAALEQHRRDLKFQIGKRLRWVGKLTDTEKKALGASTD